MQTPGYSSAVVRVAVEQAPLTQLSPGEILPGPVYGLRFREALRAALLAAMGFLSSGHGALAAVRVAAQQERQEPEELAGLECLVVVAVVALPVQRVVQVALAGRGLLSLSVTSHDIPHSEFRLVLSARRAD